MFKKVKTVEEVDFFDHNPIKYDARYSGVGVFLMHRLMDILFPVVADNGGSRRRLERAASILANAVGEYQVKHGVFITPEQATFELMKQDRSLARYVSDLIKERDELRDKLRGLERTLAFSNAGAEQRCQDYPSIEIEDCKEFDK